MYICPLQQNAIIDIFRYNLRSYSYYKGEGSDRSNDLFVDILNIPWIYQEW